MNIQTHLFILSIIDLNFYEVFTVKTMWLLKKNRSKAVTIYIEL